MVAISFKTFGGNPSCVDNGSGTINARISTESRSGKMQVFDYSALNLKPSYQNSVAQTQSAVSITLTDFNSISAVGNSWLLYQNSTASFSMNIGSANNASPQTWVLPTNFLTYFDGVGRSDFISPSSLPVALQIAGADKVTRTFYFDIILSFR